MWRRKIGSGITNRNAFFEGEMPGTAELEDIYSNFFSDEHMCMRAAESDGARHREGEEKSIGCHTHTWRSSK